MAHVVALLLRWATPARPTEEVGFGGTPGHVPPPARPWPTARVQAVWGSETGMVARYNEPCLAPQFPPRPCWGALAMQGTPR